MGVTADLIRLVLRPKATPGEIEKPKKDEEDTRRGEDAVLLGVNSNMCHLWSPVATRVSFW